MRVTGRGAGLLGALLVVAWLLAACGGDAGGQRPSPTATPASQARAPREDPKPLPLGLSAAMSGDTAAAGQAIQRGLQLAIDEINGQGGVGGRLLELVVRDHEGNPGKGAANVRELVERQGVAAIIGGQDTRVALAELEVVQQLQVPYVVPWASGTRIVQHDRAPNYAFRVAADDASAARFLVGAAANKLGKRSIALLVEDSAWGESGAEALTQALGQAGLRAAAVEKVKPGEAEPAAQLARVRDVGADALILVAGAPEGAHALRALAAQGTSAVSLPVLAHQEITTGPFAQLAGGEAANDVRALQTASFYGDVNIPSKRVLQGYLRKYGGGGPEDIAAPAAVANAFDALHLLARALRQAPDPQNGSAVREALEGLQTSYDGVIKRYERPFSATSHEALTADDYLLTTWRDGKLLPER